MKRLFTILLAVIFTAAGISQVPAKMSYQAVIRNSSDELVTNQAIGMRISILQGAPDGTSVYVETQNPVSNNNGLISIEIGGGTPLTGTFAGVNWSTGLYFIKTEIDPYGGSAFSITGTSQIMSVPYALYANSAGISKDNKSFDLYVKDNGVVVGLPKISVEKPYGPVPTVTDIEGNTYGTVKIGTQIWMAENLRTTKYRNGDLIGTTTPSTLNITSETTPKYQWAFGAEINASAYGRLYTWYAANDSRNVCPMGWHLPSEAEFTTLIKYLGSLAGYRLKEPGTQHWSAPNIDAIGDSQFNGVGGGYREYFEQPIPSGFITRFWGLKLQGFWWSATDYVLEEGPMGVPVNMGTCFSIHNFELEQNAGIHTYEKHFGMSIRCLKD